MNTRLLVPRRLSGTKHTAAVRHSGAREQARRLKQIRAGQVKGPVVSDAARYAAHGLIAPDAR